jgi:hypothetical protein
MAARNMLHLSQTKEALQCLEFMLVRQVAWMAWSVVARAGVSATAQDRLDVVTKKLAGTFVTQEASLHHVGSRVEKAMALLDDGGLAQRIRQLNLLMDGA